MRYNETRPKGQAYLWGSSMRPIGFVAMVPHEQANHGRLAVRRSMAVVTGHAPEHDADRKVLQAGGIQKVPCRKAAPGICFQLLTISPQDRET